MRVGLFSFDWTDYRAKKANVRVVCISSTPSVPSEVKDSGRISEESLLFPRCKESGGSSEDSNHIRFFSFSLIEGYISLVMDEQTTQRSRCGQRHTTPI